MLRFVDVTAVCYVALGYVYFDTCTTNRLPMVFFQNGSECFLNLLKIRNWICALKAAEKQQGN